MMCKGYRVDISIIMNGRSPIQTHIDMLIVVRYIVATATLGQTGSSEATIQ